MVDIIVMVVEITTVVMASLDMVKSVTMVILPMAMDVVQDVHWRLLRR